MLSIALILTASAATIEAASGNWSNIPPMPATTQMMLGASAMKSIDAAARQGKCPVIGDRNRVRLDMPVLVQFGSGKDVKRVIVSKIGCPEVEQIVGNAALHSANAGRFRPTGENQTGWYRGRISYWSDNRRD